MEYYVPSCFSCVWLFVTLWTVAHQSPLSMGFSRQQYWSGLPCPSPGDLPNAGIEPVSPEASALQVDSLLLSHQGILLSYKKEWNNVTCSRDYHTEWSQTEKDRRKASGQTCGKIRNLRIHQFLAYWCHLQFFACVFKLIPQLSL